MGNFEAPQLSDYTPGESAHEYEICFKCHSGYWWLPGTPPPGLSANGTATTPVQTDLAQEFSPLNKSGHPIVTGLDNFTNSIAVGSPAKKGLWPGIMKPPFNVNLGQQTMMCADCHNTDAALPAAQGPHGSAVPFMLRQFTQPAVNAWPDVVMDSSSTQANSFCGNCHELTGGGAQGHPHNEGGHWEQSYGTYLCYNCHIVIPHGGKMSRLIGDGDGSMPARYAWNNDKGTMTVTGFTKRSPGAYGTSDCEANCYADHQNTSPQENW